MFSNLLILSSLVVAVRLLTFVREDINIIYASMYVHSYVYVRIGFQIPYEIPIELGTYLQNSLFASQTYSPHFNPAPSFLLSV